MKTYKTILTSNYTNREEAIDSDSAQQLANELETMFQYLGCDMRENGKDNKGDKNFSFCWQLQDEEKNLCDLSICYYKDNKNWYMTFKINGCEITSMGMRTEMIANLCEFIKSNKLRLGIYVSNIATKEHFK